MRLFTAVIFDDDVKDTLCGVMDKLRSLTDKGSFTLRENLHLTLNFIGETDKAKLITEAMKKAVSLADTKAFNLTFAGFGRFKRREGDICWIGVEKNEQLFRLQKELTVCLTKAGFVLEDREYTPHLTLARRVRFNDKFNQKEFETAVPRITQ
ncbi:MAG TPA: RNA 2',3'-cyclic phosphodiesterase, partial [Mobilitalea sp.]|nr:RNA 2',3'-cyclic phosphodiesterase [Mobilitalea sp.]